MKTATVSDVRNNFGQLLRWLAKGQTVQIVKRGRPLARIIPEATARPLLGCMEGTGNVPPDLDEPLPIKWKAAAS